MARKSDFIRNYRQRVNDLLDVLEELDALRTEYQALDYANELVDTDFTVEESNDDLTAAEFKSGVDSIGTMLETISGTAHEVNLYTLKG